MFAAGPLCLRNVNQSMAPGCRRNPALNGHDAVVHAHACGRRNLPAAQVSNATVLLKVMAQDQPELVASPCRMENRTAPSANHPVLSPALSLREV
jgi:hypothetical protein